MKYVYLVYENWNGLIAICGSPERATQMVKDNVLLSGLEDTPPDYDSEKRWGWQDEAWWVREKVVM